MDHDALAALFRRIVLAGAPLLSACGGSGSCPRDFELTTTVSVSDTDAAPPDGSVDDLVARCQASVPDCTPLCQHTIQMYPGAYTLKQCELIASNNGLEVHVVYTPKCVGGRCPEGLAAPALTRAGNPLGAWLAACAHLEAASIDAFDILAAELGRHGAPGELMAAARAAARDERRHAAVVGGLAARQGSATPPVHVARGPIRDLESIARENAVEGCVRETHAALVACRQARVAGDPEVRGAMAGIARDETRHAALAWAVDGWASTQLAPAARRRVRDARHEAIEQLLAEASAGPLAPTARVPAGLPDPDEAVRMVTSLRAQLPS